MVLTVRKRSAQSLIEEEKSEELSSSGSNASAGLNFDNQDGKPDHGMYSPSASRSKPPTYDFSQAMAGQRQLSLKVSTDLNKE